MPELLSAFKCVHEVRTNRYVVFHMVLPCVGSPLLLAEVLGYAASSLWGEEGLVLLLCWLPPQDKAGD